MDARARTQLGLLAALVVALAAVLAWQLWPAPAAAPNPAPRASRPEAAAGVTSASGLTALGVKLADLEAVAPEPPDAGRDPFRFRPEPAPPPPPVAPVTRPPVGGDAGGGLAPGEPPPPPPPPPITLKFIGLLTEGPDQRKVAVLSDGRFVFHGHEGDIIEGRFRVVRIGDESVQLEYADGRGRQTIRLSGS